MSNPLFNAFGNSNQFGNLIQQAQEFKKQFDKEYNFLYDNEDRVAGYSEAVRAFDKFMDTNIEFIREFVLYRNLDPISSDREAAAFMFALETFM